MRADQPARRPLRLGIVGGGAGSHIGETHRQAARMDGRYVLVAGVFAADAARSRAFATDLGLAPSRRYADWQEMAVREAARDDGEIDPLALTFPTVEDGVLGVMFIEAAVTSNQQDGRWVSVIREK